MINRSCIGRTGRGAIIIRAHTVLRALCQENK